MRKNCVYCGIVFNKDNNSMEHLIPEGIGGKLSRKNLLCKECNNKSLGKLDRALQEHLSLFLNLKRIKGKRNKEVSVKGESDLGKVIFKDGMPIVLPTVINNTDGSKTIVGDKIYTEEIFEGLKKANPNLEIKGRKDEILSLITLNLIDQNIWKGIGKILYLFTHYFNEHYIPKTDFFKNFLSQPEENNPFISPIVWAKKDIEKTLSLPEEALKFHNDCHLVIIDYRNEEKCIIGYINFFGLGYIGLIDDSYERDTEVKGYYINVKSKESNEFECRNQLNITRKVLIELIRKGLTQKSLKIFREQYSQAFEDTILSKDVEDIFSSVAEEMGLKEGELANEEFFSKFFSKFMNSNYMKNKLKRSKKPK